MFISFILSAFFILSTAPLGISHLYQLEIEYQENQILLDNVAIRLGQQGRSLLNQIRRAEIQLEKLHALYHTALACSLIPATAIACRASAQSLRKTLHAVTVPVIPGAVAQWMEAVRQAKRDLEKSKEELQLVTVNGLNPAPRSCKVCQQANGWNFPQKVLPAFLFSKKVISLRSRVVHEKEKKGFWNYRLLAH